MFLFCYFIIHSSSAVCMSHSRQFEPARPTVPSCCTPHSNGEPTGPIGYCQVLLWVTMLSGRSLQWTVILMYSHNTGRLDSVCDAVTVWQRLRWMMKSAERRGWTVLRLCSFVGLWHGCLLSESASVSAVSSCCSFALCTHILHV